MLPMPYPRTLRWWGVLRLCVAIQPDWNPTLPDSLPGQCSRTLPEGFDFCSG